MVFWKNLSVTWKLTFICWLIALVPMGVLVFSMDGIQRRGYQQLSGAAPQTDLDRIQRQSGTATLKLVSVVTLLVMVGGYGVASLLVRPIVQFAQTAQKLIAGDTHHTLIEAGGHDEIAIIRQTFHVIRVYFEDMARIANQIAQGDLETTFTPRSSQDQLGQAFQGMLAYLQRMAAVIATIAEGDFRQEVTSGTEHDALGKAIQQLQSLRTFMRQIITGTEKMGDASAVLKQISTDMAAGAEEVSRQTNMVSANSEQISHNMTSVSSATEEFLASIREISRMTQEVSQIATSATDVTNAASMTIFSLKADSEAIGDIVKLINDIAQQTNLLALNATIEAARAGESGRGFSVVAGEVKELARATTKALDEITKKIEAIQSSSKDVTGAVVQLSEIIHQIHELSTAIAAAIEQQTATTRDISHNITETAHGNDEITKTMSEVAAATVQVSDQTAHVQDAAEELSALAEELRHVVKKFKV